MSFEYSIFTGGPGGQIQEKKVSRVKKSNDVVIKVTHSGLCFTDTHMRHRDIALGHEGAGVVIEVGSAVERHKVGDRVSFGFLRGVCGHCEECLDGEDMYCLDADLYSYPGASHDIGSLASHAIISETFVFKIPDNIPSAHAAPFMCAGATVFEPLFRGRLRPASRIGILGVGGLGHLAIQFARAMGFTVVVFSTNDSKREEAFKLGAHEFVVFKGVEKLDIAPVRTLFVVSSTQPDWKLFMPVLSPRATIYPLTVDIGGSITIPAMPLIANGMRLQGSEVAPRSVYAPMLAFAAANNVRPMIEEFPMTAAGIEKAFETLQGGKLRYRAVLVAQD